MIGDSFTAAFDSADAPAEYAEFNRYSKMKQGERTIYRDVDYVEP